jgi:hypothetical protein
MSHAILAQVNDSLARTGVSGIVAKLRKAIRIEIPIGYQDDTGFHRGVEPAENEFRWPRILGEGKHGSISMCTEFQNLLE